MDEIVKFNGLLEVNYVYSDSDFTVLNLLVEIVGVCGDQVKKLVEGGTMSINVQCTRTPTNSNSNSY